MADSTEKILIFTSREICYNSHSFFAHQLADAFEKLNQEVELCAFTKEDNFDLVLKPYIGKTYRMMLDFNSLLPQLIEEDGTPILNLIKGPFYDYILDHPLFHYNCLSVEANDFHAILLDEAQEKYVKRYHPNVKSTMMMPLAATEAFTKEKTKKQPESILFIGSYDSEERLKGYIDNAPDPYKDWMKKLLEMRMGNPILPMETAFEVLLKEQGMKLKDDAFAFCMNHMYPVDAYVRNYYRRIAIETLAQANIPVKIVGEGWQRFQSKYEHSIRREKEVEFSLSFEKIAREHILLNSSPIFNHGAHDRIYAGMANHCAVMTDENPYLCKTLRNGENVMLYSLKDPIRMKDIAEELMTNKRLLSDIKEQGYIEYQKNHTWESIAKQLLQEL